MVRHSMHLHVSSTMEHIYKDDMDGIRQPTPYSWCKNVQVWPNIQVGQRSQSVLKGQPILCLANYVYTAPPYLTVMKII